MNKNNLSWSPIILLLFMGFFQISFGEKSQISGKIIDENRQPLAGVNIAIDGTVLGAASDLQGSFSIQRVPAGPITVVISMIGYQTEKRSITIEPQTVLDIGVIQLFPKPISLETVVVTASKYEQQVQDVPASLGLISRSDLQLRNILTIDRALQYVPGVNMNASQMNIRGSSGYSRGVGTRVFFLIDGIPILTGDTREVSYDVIPTHLIERIEIVKGAGSALYGSSALGGVVNIITRDIRQSPQMYFKYYLGRHSKSAFSQWNWSDDTQNYSGFSGNISHKFKNLGIQLGGNYDKDDGYRQNDTRKRYSGSGKLEYDFSPYHQITFAGNYMEQDRDEFLYWKDFQHALQPPADQLGNKVETKRYYLTGQYRYIMSKNQFLVIKGIWFRNRFRDNIANNQGSGNDSKSSNLYSEVQYTSRLKHISLTTGVSGNADAVASNIFGNHSGSSFAGYFQAEGLVLHQVRLTTGVRMDYFRMDSVESDYQINPKFGAVYTPYAGTALRTSVSWGFRAPSLAEVFTSTDASGFQVIPNTHLKPENSTSFEIGINQIFRDHYTFDIASFHSRYRNLIEGEFLPTGEIQFQNITAATIWGIEATINGAFLENKLFGNLSYTYVNPRDKETNDYLKFRPRHLFYVNLNQIVKKFQVALDYRFIKKYDRIDEKFALLIEDAEQRVDAHIVDLRLLWNVKINPVPFRVTFQINNILRYHYVDLVGSLAPLRGFTLTLETGF
ncbi:MAG: TonB-dependent receptor [bacterium]|nr:MAG: TonB-dependent receptor [bacterium]